MKNKTVPDEHLENELREKGYAAICGVDEAGRGPLSGPVVAAACILPAGCVIEGLNDSKKLTPKQRDRLFDTVRETAIAYSIGTASPEEIDEINILNATMRAMKRAIDGLPVKADFALIDGNCARGIGSASKTTAITRNTGLRNTRDTGRRNTWTPCGGWVPARFTAARF